MKAKAKNRFRMCGGMWMCVCVCVCVCALVVIIGSTSPRG